MLTLETAIQDYAYEIAYEFREDNFGRKPWILAIKMWCPLSDEWLPIDLKQIPNMNRLYERLDTAEVLRGK